MSNNEFRTSSEGNTLSLLKNDTCLSSARLSIKSIPSILSILLMVLLFAVFARPAAAAGLVVQLDIKGIIGQATENYVKRGIRDAEQKNASAVLITIDTPGGLMESMKNICTAMQKTNLPVIVYVTPNGATATSAGFFILMGSDVAAMSPNTSTGSSHPVGINPGGGGDSMGKVESEKAENYAASYMKSLVERRSRNFDFAEKAVRQSVSITASDAIKQHVIEIIAPDAPALLAAADGTAFVKNGRTVTMRTKGAGLEVLEMSPREQFFELLGNPNIAYILFIVGVYALIFEVTHPGAIFPGVVGGLCLVCAFVAFSVIPINSLGLVLIVGGFVLFLLEIKIVSHGLLSAGGVALLVIGSLMLVDTPEAAMQINVGLIVGVAVGTFLFIVVALAYIIRSLRSRVTTGAQGMIGEIGKVRTRLAPEGHVFVHGELWTARAEGGAVLEPGTRVEVVSMQGMEIVVRPADRQ